MKKPSERILAALLSIIFVFLIFTAFILTTAAEEEHLSLSAKSASLYEPSSNTFLYTKNADTPLPMASTTKIMTALVVLESLDLTKEVEVPEAACNIEGSSLYLKPGERLTVKDLLLGLMLRSANDAAVALAYAVSGGVTEFAELMNKRAASLNLAQTSFRNPHGLDDKDHYTTARELALICAEALKNDDFKSIVSSRSVTITNADGYSRTIVNHNKLLRLYDGAIGVKTGYTKSSGRSLVGAAERGGITLVSVTINAPDDWDDHEKLLDYGFSSVSLFSVEKGNIKYSIPLIGGKLDTVTVTNKDDFKLVYKNTEAAPTLKISLPRYTSVPLTVKDTLGKALIYKDGKLIAELVLTPDNDAN